MWTENKILSKASGFHTPSRTLVSWPCSSFLLASPHPLMGHPHHSEPRTLPGSPTSFLPLPPPGWMPSPWLVSPGATAWLLTEVLLCPCLASSTDSWPSPAPSHEVKLSQINLVPWLSLILSLCISLHACKMGMMMRICKTVAGSVTQGGDD